MTAFDFQAYPCPRCGAAIGAPCVSAAGRPRQTRHDVHVARLRVRHCLPPTAVQVRFAYPRRPKTIGVLVVSPAGVQVLAALVAGR